MKLVVFAHTPPPHHGQSYMVQLMLDGFGGDHRKKTSPQPSGENTAKYDVVCYHVNARLSRDLEDIGELRAKKFFLLFRYCVCAIWCRFRYGAKNLYYIPAPGKSSALFRDWMVMFFCRPFFSKIILHWHAAGLSKWLETSVQIRSRAYTYKYLKQADLSVVLSAHNRADAEKLLPKKITLVANGIPDPCPDFETTLLPIRLARQEARKKIHAREILSPDEQSRLNNPQIFRVLYLAHCTREKGLFDTIEGVMKASEKLKAAQSPFSIQLQIAGGFVNQAEEREFKNICALPGAQPAIQHIGFVSGAQKSEALKNADLFCFPTHYRNENQPVNLIEAMAFGLPVITTRWRSVPETLPKGYPGIVDPKCPEQIAEKLLAMMTQDLGDTFRQHFLGHFTIERHLENLAAAFHSIE